MSDVPRHPFWDFPQHDPSLNPPHSGPPMVQPVVQCNHPSMHIARKEPRKDGYRNNQPMVSGYLIQVDGDATAWMCEKSTWKGKLSHKLVGAMVKVLGL